MNIKINKKFLNKNYEYIKNIYNTSIVLDHFCNTCEGIEELGNIKPLVGFIKNESDLLCYNFLNILYGDK